MTDRSMVAMEKRAGGWNFKKVIRKILEHRHTSDIFT
jgi:hypothetical protein